jgi:hypothetical protein
VAPFAESVGADCDDLLHHAEDRVTDALGLLLELAEVDVLDPALGLDLARGFRRMMPSRPCTRASAASISK